ncbi:hypothetical protein GCM10020367_14590 [Streptomyces sannanensis]|uniref:Uncharacterized protein n=1 Tax=Streptomyces sannanensis TaxID=285536 RepID=A0ABP6S811_9ACTN
MLGLVGAHPLPAQRRFERIRLEGRTQGVKGFRAGTFGVHAHMGTTGR